MDFRTLFRQLLFVNLSLIAVYFLSGYFVSALSSYWDLFLSSLLLFNILSIIMYRVGYKAAIHSNKNRFTQAAMVMIFGKMFLSLFLILAYNAWAAPDSKWFLLPFFLAYFAFTAYETLFLSKLGQIK